MTDFCDKVEILILNNNFRKKFTKTGWNGIVENFQFQHNFS